MEFRLLGEVEVRAAGQLLDVGTPRQQAVLAALALDPGRPVPIETLIDRIWGDEPPAEARNVRRPPAAPREPDRRAGGGGARRRGGGGGGGGGAARGLCARHRPGPG